MQGYVIIVGTVPTFFASSVTSGVITTFLRTWLNVNQPDFKQLVLNGDKFQNLPSAETADFHAIWCLTWIEKFPAQLVDSPEITSMVRCAYSCSFKT